MVARRTVWCLRSLLSLTALSGSAWLCRLYSPFLGLLSFKIPIHTDNTMHLLRNLKTSRQHKEEVKHSAPFQNHCWCCIFGVIRVKRCFRTVLIVIIASSRGGIPLRCLCLWKILFQLRLCQRDGEVTSSAVRKLDIRTRCADTLTST